MMMPGFEILSLTAEESDPDDYNYDAEPMVEWVDDCEAQENLFQIIPLVPEEAHCDKDNHIIQEARIFFDELGYLCDEPEPIDPSMDYEAEFAARMKEQQQRWKPSEHCRRRRRRSRQQHIDFEQSTKTACSSLDHHASMQSMDLVSPGLSSTASSFHHTDDDHDDERSPYFMGRVYSPAAYAAHHPHAHHNHHHTFQHHPYSLIHHHHSPSHHQHHLHTSKQHQPHASSPLIR